MQNEFTLIGKAQAGRRRPRQIAAARHGWALLFFLLALGVIRTNAQVKVLEIDPHTTDPAIQTVHGPHLAVYDPSAPPRHRLILMLVGTGAKAAASRTIDQAFATLGFHVISLDYENQVITAGICAHSGNDACYEHYHEEIITGHSLSPKVDVDRSNCILHRFFKVLSYLARHDPDGDWRQFMRQGRIRWTRLIVAGHSQGSGHAAYLGKLFHLDRVLLFSGPQDFRSDLHRPAAWLSKKGKTPPARYFAFLHLRDPFNEAHQVANCARLMGRTAPKEQRVQPGRAIHGDPQILVTDIPTKNPHGAPLLPQFHNVWKYMLTAE